ncbi:DNA-protecting protein DprA [bacterium]|nr:DNA-protecting protein DprA [bacterium]
MTNLQWSALCSYFSIPLSIYLARSYTCNESAWSVVKEHKKWSEAELNSHRRLFLNEWQHVNLEQVLTWHDDNYPALLRRLFVPPLCLHYSGKLSILDKKNLAVVGSRQPSSLYLDWMNHELGVFLSEQDCVVVSGGAIGIDQESSRIALRHHSQSVVVVPSGMQKLYPKNIDYWLGDPNILFISEYMPQQDMRRHHFVRRNRIIAGLTKHLLVVQCAQKSGTMITAKYAMELGLSIATIPDFPGNFETSGNLNLLKEGANIVCCAKDISDFMSW